jgi:enolase-phosphatase E1
MTVAAIVTDIEGTTSSIDFVHQILYPSVIEILDAVRTEAGEADADQERVIEILLLWIDQDRKATPLKALQGMIWKHGYESGAFTGHVYDDAAENLHKWAEADIDLYVYSSGSVAAQRLLFGHSDAGDLTQLFRGFFDTNVGPKRETDSYRKIVGDIGTPATTILFLSDVAEELDAAAAAGMQTCQLVRNDKVIRGAHRIAHDFDGVVIN